ncbi:MAG: hypothetical protein ACLGHF_00710 [Alphaproteobacteria bacterium]
MAVYFALILVFVGLLWWFNGARQKRLDADPAQQRLAELLAKAATGRGVAPQQVVDHLNAMSKGSADRRVRLTHAVMLVRSEAAPDLYEKVLELSRGI